MRLLIPLMLLLGVAGCDRGAQPADDAGRSVSGAREAVYLQRFLFLAEDTAHPVAAVIHYSATPVGADLVHITRAWLGGGAGWERVVADEWRSRPLREPGRLMPHGELRLLLQEDGDVQALLMRSSQPEVRLLPGDSIDELGGEQLQIQLRRAVLIIGGAEFAGALLHARERRPLGTRAEAAAEGLFTDGSGYHVLLQPVGADTAVWSAWPVEDGPPGADFSPRLQRLGALEDGVREQNGGPGTSRRWLLLSQAEDAPADTLHVLGSGWVHTDGSAGYGTLEGVRGSVAAGGAERTLLGVLQSAGRTP